MGLPAADLRISYAAYLLLESKSEVRHEYVDGTLYAMSGGKPVHARLASAVTEVLGPALRGGPCATYSSDLRVYIPADGRSTYPDLTVICGPVEHHPVDPDAAINPSVIVEVLSDSTEAYDRGEKFSAYRTLPSLADFVMLLPDAVRIEHFQRRDGGQWVFRACGPGDVLALASGATLAVDDVYAGVELLPRRAPRTATPKA